MISSSKAVFSACGVLCLFQAGLLWASSDDRLSWDLSSQSVEAVPYLALENDTRVNLLMLEAERHQLTIPAHVPTEGQEKEIKPLFTGYEAIDYESFISARKVAEEQQAVLSQAVSQSATELNLPAEVITQISTIETQEGRCISNDIQAVHQFLQALNRDQTLTPIHRQSLALARFDIAHQQLCTQADALNQPLTEQLLHWPEEGNARAFAHYLLASLSFYAGDFEQARQRFTQLADHSSPWLAEASTYMLARVALNHSAVDAMNEWGWFNSTKIDLTQITAAKNQLDHYLQRYPQGVYAHSAEGLYRRLYWMQGDLDKLAEAYQQAFMKTTDLPTLVTLVFEVDINVLEDRKFSGSLHAPNLTFVQALKNQRPPELRFHEGYGEEISTSLLSAPHSRYITLIQAFVRKEYQQVVNEIAPPPPNPLSLLEFSQQVLKGKALLALERYGESEQLWRSLLKTEKNRLRNRLLQKMLAQSLALNGKVDEIFAPHSPVTSLILRQPYLFFISEQQLRTQATDNKVHPWERVMALQTLLLNELLLGRYTQFVQDDSLRAPLIAIADELNESWKEFIYRSTFDLAAFDWQGTPASEGYACASLIDIVKSLSKKPNDARARNCLSEFLRATDLDKHWSYRQYQQKIGVPHLHLFNVKETPQHRLSGYMQVIKNPQVEIEDKSYALYRAIHCFSSTGYNRCGPEAIPQSVRKQWFQQLKKEYGDTVWGKNAKYYW